MKLRQLRSKEIKELKKQFPELITGKNIVEKELSDDLKVILDKGVPLLGEKEEVIFPTLFSKASLPTVVVDMGAVRFVTNGADVMAPGVKEKPAFKKGDLLYIVDEKNLKKLAVVQALVDSENFPEKGKVFKNLHWVGDRIWRQQAS